MKLLRNILFCVALLLGTWVSLGAQNIRFYSSDNDLSNSLINEIYQDHIGYIWICTEYGLNKFDGQRFTHYYHHENEPLSISANYVRTIFEDNKNRLWVGCINGLMRYDREKNGFIKIPLYVNNKEVSTHVTDITQIHNDEIWISTSGQGVFKLSAQGNRADCLTQLTQLLNTKFLINICEDSHNNLWFGSENDGLIFYHPIKKQIHIYRNPELKCERIQSMVEDRNGHLFIGTLDNGLFRIDLVDFSIHEIPYKGLKPIIKSLYINAKGTLLIGSDGKGLMYYDPITETIKDKVIDNLSYLIEKGKVHALLEDRDGNHWIGLFQKGVVCVPSIEKQFKVWNIYDHNQLTQTGSSCAIFEDHSGNIWNAIDCDGLYKLDKQGHILRHYPVNVNGMPSTILSIFQDSDGVMWLGSYGGGLNKFNPEAGVCSQDKTVESNYVTSIVEDKNKRLYVASLGNGIWVIDKKKHSCRHLLSSRQESTDVHVNELANDYISTLYIDNQQNLWIGHYQGISCYHITKNSFIANPWQSNNILQGDVCYSISQDEKGDLWCGTYNGLVKLEPRNKQIKRYDTNDGLNNDIVCGVLIDNRNNIWCSTYLGIGKFNPKTNKWENYYLTDGLQGNQFTNGSTLKDSNDRLYFGGTNGTSVFTPSHTEKPIIKLNVTLTSFYVYDTSINSNSCNSSGGKITQKSIEDTETVQLSYNDNTFTIEFSTFDFSNPERIGYQYKLEGLSNEWTTTRPGMSKVTYNNLPQGNYRFVVRAYEHDSFSPERTINIHIASPWYSNGLAILCYVLVLFILFAYLTYITYQRWNEHQLRLQQEQEDQINEAKLQFFINISHEIRTPMTLIINPLEKLLKECADAEIKKTYGMMYRNGQRILRLINQLLDVRKLDKGQMFIKCRETDMVGFINDVMHTFEYQAQKKNIRFSFFHEMDILNVWIDVNQFDKILLNLLSNAFKYTNDGGTITVSLQTTPADTNHPQGGYIIKVTDNGIGIDKEKMDHIFERFYQINNNVTNTNFGTGIGLHLTRSLVELHHGLIKAENRTDGTGAIFSILMPLGNSYLSENEFIDSDEKVTMINETLHPNRKSFEQTKDDSDTSTNKSSNHHKTRYTLLLVEDEEDILNYLVEEFSGDYKILKAHNGREAWETVLNQKLDLIVTDVMMPEMDGITFCKKLKHNPNICHIPVVLLTAKTKMEDKMEGLEIGADAYIVKPFHTEQLRGVIQNLIGNRERLRNKFSGAQEQEDKLETIKIKSSDEQLMERIMKIINNHLSDSSLSVEMVASEVGISRVHLHRKLKELTSLSARDFIKSIRMKQAANLLSSKKMGISEVAYATGFNNLSHFSSSFHEFYGQTPTEYMNSHLSADTGA